MRPVDAMRFRAPLCRLPPTSTASAAEAVSALLERAAPTHRRHTHREFLCHPRQQSRQLETPSPLSPPQLLGEMRALGLPCDVYTFSTLISCCYKAGEHAFDTAVALFAEMRLECVAPNVVTLNSMLAMCARARRSDEAMQLFRWAVRS